MRSTRGSSGVSGQDHGPDGDAILPATATFQELIWFKSGFFIQLERVNRSFGVTEECSERSYSEIYSRTSAVAMFFQTTAFVPAVTSWFFEASVRNLSVRSIFRFSLSTLESNSVTSKLYPVKLNSQGFALCILFLALSINLWTSGMVLTFTPS